ncbi:hypothetical protein GKZ28_17765 [Clostridium chromiireducens]|uniref:Uncharacterized protein n=1 Tax=Clostridium chromiireducens TaxID=225345 RepID=A0A964RPT4_9CLOT|nr:hypothetical protein [Clostridium chromiireducens]MVX65532.1 hypothetical protein [Clostridium chromiireducens]
MSLLGSIVKGAGAIAGKGLELGIKATGEIGGIIADCNGNYKLGESFRENSKVIGEVTYECTKMGGEFLGNGVDKAIDIGAKTGAEVAQLIAEEGGLDVEKSRKIGSAVGAGAVGLLTGEVIGGAITTVTALTGTASTGVAISSLHGVAASKATVAAIGGGALSAGGGGIAAGQAILNGIDIVSTVSASASAISADSKANKEKQLAGEFINVSEDDYTVLSGNTYD